MSTPSRILLVIALVACGDPGSDTVFQRGLQQRDSADAAARRGADLVLNARPWKGLYRRLGEQSLFQPCATTVPLEVIGTGDARRVLAERSRWNTVWQGQPMFAVLLGAIVTDTARPPTSNPARDTVMTVRTRFFVAGVDSIRTWERTDCGGMRIR